MRDPYLRSMMTVAVATGVLGSVTVCVSTASAQAPAASVAALKTPWGEPDLQGIWTDETDTPLQRSPKFANIEVFSEAQRAELDKQRSALLRRERRVERGT